MSNKIFRIIAGTMIIILAIWAFYNPELAKSGYDQVAPVVLTKLLTISPWLIIIFARDIVRGVIDALVTGIILYIVYIILVHYGILPDVLPNLLSAVIDAIKNFRLLILPTIM